MNLKDHELFLRAVVAKASTMVAEGAELTPELVGQAMRATLDRQRDFATLVLEHDEVRNRLARVIWENARNH